MAYDRLKNRNPETSFRLGNWYDNTVDPLQSGRFVQDLGDNVILSKMGKEFSVEKRYLEAAKELR